MHRWLVAFAAFAAIVYSDNSTGDTVAAVRVIRIQIDYTNASISNINNYSNWKMLLQNSVLASLRFINKHWLICGEPEYQRELNDCGKLEVTGEVVGPNYYRINATFIAQRDPIQNAKQKATSTVFAVVQIGLKGGIFQYTNELKVLGKPNTTLNLDEEFFCYRGSVLVDEDKCTKCLPGTYHNQATKQCIPCQRGTYQPNFGQYHCFNCQNGYTTVREGTKSKRRCIIDCPEGHFLDQWLSRCLPCGYTAYQPRRGLSTCLPCPAGTITLTSTAVSIDQCKSNCPPGHERIYNGSCVPCHVGFFKTAGDLFCRPCKRSVTTESTGAISETQCNITNCKPGSYLNQEFGICLRCPFGQYQDDDGAKQCKNCPSGFTTRSFGSTSLSQCISMNQCETGEHRCHWLAACFDLPDIGNQPRYGCKCQPGFVGNGFECTDICFHLCFNGGKCIKTSQGFPKCLCGSEYKGKRCELKQLKEE